MLKHRNIPQGKYLNAFLGYGLEDSHFVLELTYNYGVEIYDIITGFGHFAIATEDVGIHLQFVVVFEDINGNLAKQ